MGRAWAAYMQMVPSSAWFWLVAVVPFMLVVGFRGWDETFRTGEAYLYLIGVTIAVFGEIGLELSERGLEGIKRLGAQPAARAVFGLCAALATAVWGVDLVVTQPRMELARFGGQVG